MTPVSFYFFINLSTRKFEITFVAHTVFLLDTSAPCCLNGILDFSFPYGLRRLASVVGTPWFNSCYEESTQPQDVTPTSMGSLFARCKLSVLEFQNEMQVQSNTQQCSSIVVCDSLVQRHPAINEARCHPGYKGARQRALQFLPAMGLQWVKGEWWET